MDNALTFPGLFNSRNPTAPSVVYGDGVPEIKRVLFNDAQTSGGLLMSLPEERVETLMNLLVEKGVEGASVVGRVVPGADPKIRVGA